MTSPSPPRASVVPLNVVAAKKPGQYIVRAVSPFKSMVDLVCHLLPIVGTLDPDIEWTGYSYEGWPGYVVYGEPRLPWPTGVFMFPHKGSDCYGPAERLGDVR